MNNDLLFVGIDVDDKAYHVSVFQHGKGEVSVFVCKPDSEKLIKKLIKLNNKIENYRICYESSYIGFSLSRKLIKKGFDCNVIASGLIPQLSSDRVKTDKRDSRKLAEYLAKDLLTIVQMPSKEDEADRNLIRSRQFLSQQISNLKKHIIGACRINDLNYKLECDKSSHWTKHHIDWLYKKSKSSNISEMIKTNISTLLSLLNQMNESLGYYNDHIQKLAMSEKYNKKVKALECFKGLATLTSMTLITEIGDISRFGHPSQLMSYAGLGVREYSSGGNERKYGITKMGNKFIRTAVIEANQQPYKPPYVSRWLSKRREGAMPEIISIATKCQHRIYKKAIGLYHREKCKNKVKVACAREMLGFIWEALHTVTI